MESVRSTPLVRYYGTDPATPEPIGDAIQDRIELADLEFELPRERRPSAATLASLAALACVLAIVLGSWAFVTALRDGDSAVAAAVPVERAPAATPAVVSMLAKPSTQRIAVQGSVGRIVLAVGARSFGALVLDGLGPAPEGRSYQAWLIRPGAAVPVSAAVFDGRRATVQLRGRVPPGSTVAITLERSGGAPALTRTPRLLARRT